MIFCMPAKLCFEIVDVSMNIRLFERVFTYKLLYAFSSSSDVLR